MASGKTLAAAVAFELALGAAALVVGPWLGIHAAEDVHAEGIGRDLFWGLVGSIPPLAAYAAAIRSGWGVAARLHAQVRRLLDDWLLPARTWELAAVSLAAGIGEELLFRGLLQGLLAHHLGRWAGWILASLMFGAIHPLSTAYVVAASIMGGYLGGLWIWSGSLTVPIVVHAVYDFVVLLELARPGRGGTVVARQSPDLE